MRNIKTKVVLLLLMIFAVLGGCMAQEKASDESYDYGAPQSANDFTFEMDSKSHTFSITDEDGYPVNNAIVVNGVNKAGSAAMVTATGSDIQDVVSLSKKIIKTGSLSIDVVDLDKVVDDIKVLVDANNAYIHSSSRRDYDNFNRVNMTIRVPVEIFDTLYETLSGYGEVTLDETNAQDVTEEYFDLEIRLATLEAKKVSFTKLLDKAKNVTEILQIENELNRVIYDIESVKGRMTYLDRNVAMSTINLSIFERNPASTIEKNFVEKLKFAIKDGWGSMLNFIMNVILFLVWVLPFTPIILIVFYLLRRVWCFIKARRSKKKDMQL